MVDILVSPPEGCCGFVVLLDVADELSRQIGFGSEDSSSNDMALNFGKPDFDLIEPARIGRSVMNPNGRIGVEELENACGFMCAQVVGHDVESLSPQVGWRRSCPKSRQIRRWYAEPSSYR
jgi:hypothetical protein